MRPILRHSFLLAIVPPLGTLVGPLGAQDSVQVVPDAVTCLSCSLDVSAVVELGDAGGPGIVTDYARIGRSEDGDYYVPFPPEGRLLRFSADGVFRAAIGRTGEGPGEYFYPVLMHGNADTLLVLDTRTARVTTILGDEITTSTLPFIPGDWAVLPDGRHVYFAVSFEPDRGGHPLHLVDDASRRITRSFGGEGVRADRSRESQAALERRVAAAPDGNVWAARGKPVPDRQMESGRGPHHANRPRCAMVSSLGKVTGAAARS